MTIAKYQEKRKFGDTPEPKGKVKKGEKLPVFCIQKHDASHLHYDFRLEHKGVLLSWAVPKGPSMNPLDKRLAIHVEDHPYDYRNFEGVIPKGNYGAGTVMIWDEGVYACKEATNKKDIEKAIDKGLKKGHLEFILEGEKLHGSFSLVKLHTDQENQWLLIKGKDESAKKVSTPLEKLDYSARTKRSLKEIGGKITEKKSKKVVKLPKFFKPMLATLVDKAFTNKEWLFETKWDGYRTLAYVDKGVELYSRNENSFNEVFEVIVKELKSLKVQAIFDGEVVVLNPDGKSDFQAMQNYQTSRKGALYYYVFDLLFYEGEDLRSLPLIERKDKLKEVIDKASFENIRYSDHIEVKGEALFKKALEYDLEGIIAKKMDSTYQSRRSHDWLKIKTHKRQEAVIIGFTEPRESRKGFGSLLLGLYDDNGKLTYIGHVGTGFTDKSLHDILEKLKPLIQDKSPLSKAIKTNMPATWVKPKLVCEVSFTEWTHEGSMRHPSFEGLRIDKKPKDVKKEREEK